MDGEETTLDRVICFEGNCDSERFIVSARSTEALSAQTPE